MTPSATMPTQLDTNTLLERISRDKSGHWFTQCHELTLSSAYQPIVSLNHRRVVGQEALIRARNARGNYVSPLQLFSRPKSIEETIELDRLCRLLHGFNFSSEGRHNEWLFLNVVPEVINHGHRHGAFFSQMVQDAQLSPSQIVIEVLESHVEDESQLMESIEYYREIGCLLAIDDFGAGHSNIDRVLNLEPEIVKLDGGLLSNRTPKARRILTNLVSLLHEAGCLVVMEGIETKEDVLLAYDVDADMVQGFFFSRPEPQPRHQLDGSLFPGLDAAREKHQTHLSTFQRAVLSPYLLIFDQAIADYQSGLGFTRATQPLLQAEGIQRIYLLDERGNLVGNNLYPYHVLSNMRPQMAPMQDSSGANLSNRHYFRRAMENPETIQTTRPYLSTTDAELCVTISQRVERGGKTGVICCDLSLAE